MLLKELSATGRISLKKFYFYRSLRILPAYWAYMIVAFALSVTGFVSISSNDFLHALTFTTTYLYHPSWFIGHSWSLSVEEQFYLLWPATLCYMGRRKGMMVVTATLFVVPLVRLALWIWVPSYQPFISRTFETAADALAAGCLLAGFRDWLSKQNVYLRFLESRYFALVPLMILAGSMSFQHPRFDFLVGIPLENLSIAVLIDRVVRMPSSKLGRILNWRPLAFVGTLSYSIYLWQQLFCRRDALSNWSTWFPINLALSLICAITCYTLIEKPFLTLKEKLRNRLGLQTLQPSLLPVVSESNVGQIIREPETLVA